MIGKCRSTELPLNQTLYLTDGTGWHMQLWVRYASYLIFLYYRILMKILEIRLIDVAKTKIMKGIQHSKLATSQILFVLYYHIGYQINATTYNLFDFVPATKI